ncbi:preprotein translocase subunit SecY [Entomoplasma ellychniae]|uniref:Protein translocase subunit SecY n=1 Tax=Entomoplasma ellychniae TaxID=2114 RepID=A0A8E2QYU6_9MOLU|nr:preprotein translocase subunit SecY [Entomoplasma ellychniae]PPE04939.1 preprotein translocase subunit SecY [Entomoplasma ellychniae]
MALKKTEKTKYSKLAKKSLNKSDFANKSFFIKNKDLIKRIVFTLILLIIIRIGVYITVPGIKLTSDFQSSIDNSQFFQLLSTLGGGTIGRFSILALGVSPYITASIIVQLLSTDVIPILTRWNKSGERGRKKLDKLTKVLMIPFALMQGVATIFTLQQQGVIEPGWVSTKVLASPAFYYILVPLVMLAGSYFMLWIADQITIKGVGNGISIVIFIGIITQMPVNIIQTWTWWIPDKGESINILFSGIIFFTIYMGIFLIVIFSVVLMNEAERKIPIQQTGSGLVDAKDHTPYLPLKLNNAGVIPVIFASAIISTPITIAQILDPTAAASLASSGIYSSNGFVKFTQMYLSFSKWWGIGIFSIMVILFTFLYAQVQINPEKISENFQKSGTFIPGIKPGIDTTNFLQATINRLSLFGSIFLAAIAALPYVISKLIDLPSNLAIGGTGLIICISVAIQTTQQIQGRIQQHKFIESKKQKFTDENQNSSTHIW